VGYLFTDKAAAEVQGIWCVFGARDRMIRCLQGPDWYRKSISRKTFRQSGRPELTIACCNETWLALWFPVTRTKTNLKDLQKVRSLVRPVSGGDLSFYQDSRSDPPFIKELRGNRHSSSEAKRKARYWRHFLAGSRTWKKWNGNLPENGWILTILVPSANQGNSGSLFYKKWFWCGKSRTWDWMMKKTRLETRIERIIIGNPWRRLFLRFPFGAFCTNPRWQMNTCTHESFFSVDGKRCRKNRFEIL